MPRRKKIEKDNINEYNADSIIILSDIEHARKRYGMYIGDKNNPSSIFNEALDNALDEVQSGYSDSVNITVDYDKNLYIIEDHGRGIPHGTKVLEGGVEKDIIEVVCTIGKSGGKFNNDSYTIRSGLNGVGLVCINALSEYMDLSSVVDGEITGIKTSKGIKNYSYCHEVPCTGNGTKIEFIPDHEFWVDPRIPMEHIINRCKVASAFGMKTNLVIDGKYIDTNSTIYDLIQDDEEISRYFQFDGEVKIDSGESVKYAIIYTNDTYTRSKGYTNLLVNNQGGIHIKMIENSIIDAWSKFKIPGLLYKDYLLGLRTAIAVFVSDPVFDSQTKGRLISVNNDKKYLDKFVPEISKQIFNYLKSHEKEYNFMVKRFQEYRDSQNKLLSRKEIKDLIVTNNDTSGAVRRKSVIAKLKECTSKTRENTELLIVEGDSAAGSLVQARDIKTQAILPIRGKTLNVSRFQDYAKTLRNEEIRSMVNAAGCNILEDCDHNKSRYQRYIICADADPDGKQIECLVISIFVNLMPDIVKSGMLYIANPPLYGWQNKKGEFYFTNNQNEIPEGIEYSRYKGLGEMDPPELKYSILMEGHRNLTQVKYPDDVDYFNSVLTSPTIKYEILRDLGLIDYIN